MSPDLPAEGSARSAAEINAQIRALWPHPAVPLDDVRRAEYRRLLAELRDVEREEIVEAA